MVGARNWKMTECGPVCIGRGRKGHGRSTRRRRSPGSNNGANSASDERKEFEGRRGRRSRSRDNSAETKARLAANQDGQGETMGDPEKGAGDADPNTGHHRRDRSNGSPNSRGSS